MEKSVAIVGGGYFGIALAKALEKDFRVTLIEPRSHFVHSTAMIRAIAEPSILEKSLIPYDKLLERGKLIQARVENVSEEGVTLEDAEFIAADYIVVGTGSHYAVPFKPVGHDIDGLREANAEIHSKLKAASTVAIVGAGAVGIELAGEIAHFMPDKQITLISDQTSLLPDQPEKLGRELKSKLETAGVSLKLGSRVENLQSLSAPYAGDLKFSNGDVIPADLVFPVIGSKAESGLFESLPGITKGSANRIKVDAHLRPSTIPNVFAGGDAADTGDAMTIVAVSRHVPWLTKALKALAKGKSLEQVIPYKPWSKPPILLPLGPRIGNSFLFIFIGGDFVTRAIKGKNLFLKSYQKEFGRSSY